VGNGTGRGKQGWANGKNQVQENIPRVGEPALEKGKHDSPELREKSREKNQALTF